MLSDQQKNEIRELAGKWILSEVQSVEQFAERIGINPNSLSTWKKDDLDWLRGMMRHYCLRGIPDYTIENSLASERYPLSYKYIIWSLPSTQCGRYERGECQVPLTEVIAVAEKEFPGIPLNELALDAGGQANNLTLRVSVLFKKEGR